MTPISSPRLDCGSGEKRNESGWNSSLCPNVITIPLQALVETEQQNYSGGGRVRGGRDRGRKSGKEGPVTQPYTDSEEALLYPVDISAGPYTCGFHGSFQFILGQANKQTNSIYMLSTNLRSYMTITRAFKEVVTGRFIYISVSVHF